MAFTQCVKMISQDQAKADLAAIVQDWKAQAALDGEELEDMKASVRWMLVDMGALIGLEEGEVEAMLQ